MTLELRPIVAEEFADWGRVAERSFGQHIDDEAIEQYRPLTELDRTIAVFDGGQIVATAGAHTYELTVPGPAVVPAAGVTMVAVRASHRRRGLLTRMMEHQLDDVAGRGEPLAILTASEAGIYGRFGYGLASQHAMYAVDTRHGRFLHPPELRGRYRELDAAEAEKVFPGVHDRARRLTPGDITRSARRWTHWFLDPVRERHGGSARFYVVYESPAGEAEGYLAYRFGGDWKDGIPDHEVSVNDLVATTDEAYAALWRYALDLDLVNQVTAWGRPLDEPLRWLLADPRHLRTRLVSDFLWVRVLDVPAALQARDYGAEDSLVLAVDDGFLGRAAGTYRLDAGPEGATCSATTAEPDISLDVTSLGCLYLGGIGAIALTRAGRIVEHRFGAAQRADALFRRGPLPHCTIGF